METLNSKQASEIFTEIITSCKKDSGYSLRKDFILHGKVEFNSNGVKSHMNLGLKLKNPVIRIVATKSLIKASFKEPDGNFAQIITESKLVDIIGKNNFWFVSDMSDEIEIQFK